MTRATAVRIEPRPLSGTPLTEAWLAGSPASAALFPGPAGDLDSYLAKAREVDGRTGAEDRRLASSCLTGGGASGAARLAAFIDEGGFVVTTGQQPGLFGGPLYALYKGLTAAALASRLEAATGRPVLPVFWIASEDHDWEEVRTAHVLDVGNRLREVALPDGGPNPHRPIHRIRAGLEMAEALGHFLTLMPETDFLPRWRSLLEEACRPESTLSDAYAVLLGALLGPAGVFTVAAHHPALKRRALPLLLTELGESEAREEAILRHGAAIREAGFELQVPHLEGATNVFVEREERRERVFRDGAAYRLRGSERRITFREIEAIGEADPSRLSPNVLLRPVVESLLFPAVATVAGPGEASYLPQTMPVFAGHGIEMPVIHPRLSVAVIEGKVEKVLTKFGLGVDDLAAPYPALAGAIARDRIPEDVQSALKELRRSLGLGSARLARAIAEIDPTLTGSVKSLQSQSFALLTEVEKKAVQSLKRANDVALAQLRKARLHLFPLDQPQERVLNPFYYLVRYDQAFLDAVSLRAEEAVLLDAAARPSARPVTTGAHRGAEVQRGRVVAPRPELHEGASQR